MYPPDRIPTARLLLRRWRVDDAAALKAALDDSVGHLHPWIPAAVADSGPVEVLAERLAGHAADFDAARVWMYGIFPPGESTLLGGIGLYPRTVDARVPFDAADRVEIGYWLRADATGRGYATEATAAILAVAVALPGIACVEIRCDPRNAPSVAIPRRLGFRHARTLHAWTPPSGGEARDMMIWEHPAAHGAHAHAATRT